MHLAIPLAMRSRLSKDQVAFGKYVVIAWVSVCLYVAVGILYYTSAEGWSATSAAYFSIVTMSSESSPGPAWTPRPLTRRIPVLHALATALTPGFGPHRCAPCPRYCAHSWHRAPRSQRSGTATFIRRLRRLGSSRLFSSWLALSESSRRSLC